MWTIFSSPYDVFHISHSYVHSKMAEFYLNPQAQTRQALIAHANMEVPLHEILYVNTMALHDSGKVS